ILVLRVVFNFRDEWVDETVDVKRDDEMVVYRLSDNLWIGQKVVVCIFLTSVSLCLVRVGSDLIEPKEEWSYDRFELVATFSAHLKKDPNF
nr:hypothetical protein [Tanacetum cinerariifolium]